MCTARVQSLARSSRTISSRRPDAPHSVSSPAGPVLWRFRADLGSGCEQFPEPPRSPRCRVGCGRRRGRDRADVHRQRSAGLVRRGARRLPVRCRLRRVRCGVPVRGLVAAAADGDAQPSRLGCVPATQGTQRRRAAVARRDAPADAGVHPSPVPRPMARPPTRVLGVHPRRAGHDPADARACCTSRASASAPTATRCTCRVSAR